MGRSDHWLRFEVLSQINWMEGNINLCLSSSLTRYFAQLSRIENIIKNNERSLSIRDIVSSERSKINLCNAVSSHLNPIWNGVSLAGISAWQFVFIGTVPEYSIVSLVFSFFPHHNRHRDSHGGIFCMVWNPLPSSVWLFPEGQLRYGHCYTPSNWRKLMKNSQIKNNQSKWTPR